MALPVACQDCRREGKQIEFCNVRTYRFAALMKKCPREVGFEPAKPSIPVVKEEHIPEDEAAYLRPTYEKLGALLPVLRAPDGDVVDGKHRLQVDPAWYQQVLIGLDDPVKKAMARLVINVVRRNVSAQEKTEMLGEIAKLSGWTPQQIADSLGMSYSWVMKYLLDEFKERPGQGPSEYPVTRRVTEPGPSEVVRPPGTSDVSTTQATQKAIEPKPEPLDVADFTCPECHQDFRIVHIKRNLHRFVPVKKEPAS